MGHCYVRGTDTLGTTRHCGGDFDCNCTCVTCYVNGSANCNFIGAATDGTERRCEARKIATDRPDVYRAETVSCTCVCKPCKVTRRLALRGGHRIGVSLGLGRENAGDGMLTYIHDDETGVSLRAAGWVVDKMTDGGEWSRPSRQRALVLDSKPKRRWWTAWSAEVNKKAA